MSFNIRLNGLQTITFRGRESMCTVPGISIHSFDSLGYQNQNLENTYSTKNKKLFLSGREGIFCDSEEMGDQCFFGSRKPVTLSRREGL